MLNGWSYVNIVGTMIGPFGDPSGGAIIFTPSVRVKSPDGTYLIQPDALTYGVGPSGEVNILLLANDTPGTDPALWNWKITEKLDGEIVRSFYVFLPRNIVGGTIPYTDLFSVYNVEAA